MLCFTMAVLCGVTEGWVEQTWMECRWCDEREVETSDHFAREARCWLATLADEFANVVRLFATGVGKDAATSSGVISKAHSGSTPHAVSSKRDTATWVAEAHRRANSGTRSVEGRK
jgi:hypothetical protein